ncbi:PREDICTED: uncharacterized protein LOC108571019 [Habropoda laboriosa]|uniref:uncharacterized protein LOC108571019 n=1 Tax=Habropoda laboriosa TaxID=597456 RepID=UPI00083D7F90|nr:PREDICTED: uncharacterized protein LOC108571019 [Habropoda laboriosa]
MSKSELEVRLAPERLNDKKPCSAVNAYHNLLTLQEVRALVKDATGVEADVQKFYLESYSDAKLGFLGSHQRLCVEVKSANGVELLSFFVKVVPYDVPTQAEYVLDKCVFLKERIFYRDIVPQFYHEYKHERWTATCYLVKENMLVFEDLGAKGYSLRNKLFDKELIVSALTTLASLHASSLMAEARLGKSLKKMYPHVFMENAFSETGKTRTWFNVGVNAAVAIAEHLGLDASLIPKACEEVFPAMKTSSTKRNVVSHGDLWGNNMMFSNTLPLKCLLVDFQLLRYSPLAHDVIQFLYLCADRDFRVTWEETMLKHYYSVLCKILNSTKSICVEVPPWSELIQGIEEQRLAAVITAVIYFQTVLMDEEVSAKILNEPNSYYEFEFKDRNEPVLNAMKTDPMYCKRLTEIITELVELSFRLDKLPKPT